MSIKHEVHAKSNMQRFNSMFMRSDIADSSAKSSGMLTQVFKWDQFGLTYVCKENTLFQVPNRTQELQQKHNKGFRI